MSVCLRGGSGNDDSDVADDESGHNHDGGVLLEHAQFSVSGPDPDLDTAMEKDSMIIANIDQPQPQPLLPTSLSLLVTTGYQGPSEPFTLAEDQTQPDEVGEIRQNSSSSELADPSTGPWQREATRKAKRKLSDPDSDENRDEPPWYSGRDDLGSDNTADVKGKRKAKDRGEAGDNVEPKERRKIKIVKTDYGSAALGRGAFMPLSLAGNAAIQQDQAQKLGSASVGARERGPWAYRRQQRSHGSG